MPEAGAGKAGRVSILRVPIPGASQERAPRRTTAQRLGYDCDARLAIINADDFGLCDEVNRATIETLKHGVVSSASVMVPAPRFAEAAEFARAHPEVDIGVHLVLTSEWNRRNKWGPVLGSDAVPSLVDGEGHLWSHPGRLFARARPREAEAELRAQVMKALGAGIDVSHVDSHMFVLHGWHPVYRDMYVRIASDFGLPMRAAAHALLVPMTWRSILSGYSKGMRAVRRTLLLRSGFASIVRAAEPLGVMLPDYVAVMGLAGYGETDAYWRAVIEGLPPGLTEIYCHPALPTADLLSYADDAAERAADFRFFSSPAARALLSSANVKLIGHRLLRAAMRSKPTRAAAGQFPA
jgi:predicted glycoside hydrolase/deacetylase ChbG (UPF0249 family)